MSIEDLVTTREPVKIGDLILDATLSEGHDMSSKVTEFPVESGASMNDHIINNPRQLSVEGIITNSPTQILGGRLDRQARGTTQDGKFFGRAINRAQLAFMELERMHEAKQVVTITGHYKTYKDMAMASAPVKRVVTDGDAIQFTATFIQIQKVDLQAASFRNVVKKETAQATKKKGTQTPTKSTAPTEKRATFLKKVQRGISNLTAGKGTL